MHKFDAWNDEDMMILYTFFFLLWVDTILPGATLTRSFVRMPAFPISCERRENLKYQDFRVKRYEYIKFSLFFFSIASTFLRTIFVFVKVLFYRNVPFSPLIFLFLFFFLNRKLPPINFWYTYCEYLYYFYVCCHFHFWRVSFFLAEGVSF